MQRVVAITFDDIESVLGTEDLEVSDRRHSGKLQEYVEKIIQGCGIDCMPSFYDYKYRKYNNEYKARTIELKYNLKSNDEITDVFFYIRNKSHFSKTISLLLLDKNEYDEIERYCITEGTGGSWDHNY